MHISWLCVHHVQKLYNNFFSRLVRSFADRLYLILLNIIFVVVVFVFFSSSLLCVVYSLYSMFLFLFLLV